jgi:hypothetical protein
MKSKRVINQLRKMFPCGDWSYDHEACWWGNRMVGWVVSVGAPKARSYKMYSSARSLGKEVSIKSL